MENRLLWKTIVIQKGLFELSLFGKSGGLWRAFWCFWNRLTVKGLLHLEFFLVQQPLFYYRFTSKISMQRTNSTHCSWYKSSSNTPFTTEYFRKRFLYLANSSSKAFSFYCQNHISSKLVLAYIIFGYAIVPFYHFCTPIIFSSMGILVVNDSDKESCRIEN